jgi:enoyl-CoA hydratase/carnithine racemase
MQSSPSYFGKYPNLAFSREAETGILEVRMHTNGGPCLYNDRVQSDLVDALHDINRDWDNRVIIWTGTGDIWMGGPDFSTFGDVSDPNAWDKVYTNERRLLINMLEIDVPMISAVNGPASLHTELILTMDIILASRTTWFQDYPHLTFGIVPGDGLQVLWADALGTSRARYFLWMQEKISAEEGHRLGVVHELLEPDAVMQRAWDVARQLAKQPTLNLRYTRQALTQRLKRIVHEGIGYGMALEGLTAAHLARTSQSGKS